MSRVSGKNTEPELLVRKILHRMGFRFRLHKKDLPGNPDIVLPRHKKIIFVNGCFWHGHKKCKRAKRPETNKSFWNRKIESNMARDRKKKKELTELGWSVLDVWTCEVKDVAVLEAKMRKFLQRKV